MRNNFLHKKRFIFRRFVKVFVDTPPFLKKSSISSASKRGGDTIFNLPPPNQQHLYVHATRSALPRSAPAHPPFSRKDLHRPQNNSKKPQKKSPNPFPKNQQQTSVIEHDASDTL
jgi:hypothetical protein